MFRTEKIRKLVAMGIPESLRGRLWLLFSGEGFWGLQAQLSFLEQTQDRGPYLRWWGGSVRVCLCMCVRTCRQVLSACNMPGWDLGTFWWGLWARLLQPLGCGVPGQREVWQRDRLPFSSDFMSLFIVLRILFRAPWMCSV